MRAVDKIGIECFLLALPTSKMASRIKVVTGELLM